MSLSLFPFPSRSPVDENGKKITWPWLQWLQKVNDNLAALIGTLGAQYIDTPCGSFLDTTNQTAPANTATPMTFNTTVVSNGIKIGSPTSRILITVTGYYLVNYTFQLTNTSISIDNFTGWFRKNGTDIANSAAITAVTEKHGGVNGYAIDSESNIFKLTAGDYLELYWTTDGGSTSLFPFPASAVAPVHPASPSCQVDINFISR